MLHATYLLPAKAFIFVMDIIVIMICKVPPTPIGLLIYLMGLLCSR